MIAVNDSADLSKNSQGGCIFCTAISGALGVVHPGWEQKKTFIQIHLADALPVVVRLQFGSTSTVPLQRAEALDYGFDLPEDRTMNFVITVCDTSQPAIEIEIYRRIIPMAKLTVGDAFSTSKAETLTFANSRARRCIRKRSSTFRGLRRSHP